ncbi:glycosyltransferase [Fulvivirgaceae bacterium BMA10]|uniref:Glycosyltransferase n=1 Tax=Splendidivirga corallicola TaxID=3051826 RepID=A0ABT8KQV3_9BACT|nr:glycosyltransferase [Fulvivirgaceae bacterium BMA10]
MKVLFISSKRPSFDIVPFIKSQGESLKQNGVDLEYFIIPSGGLTGYIKAIFRLRKYLNKHQCDLIHAHYSYCGWVAVLTFTKLPIVVSFMGSDVYGSEGLKGNKKLRRRVDIAIARMLQPYVQAIIVKSQQLFDHLRSKEKAEIVPNGVDFKKFQPRDKREIRKKLGVSTEKKVVLFLGHPTYTIKNFALLKAAENVAKDSSWEVLNPYPTDPDNVPLYINSADVLVLASVLEGSPNVIKEAMASNCPIVSTDVGDVREIIGNTEGCYFTSFEPEDMAQKIKLALEFGKETTGRKDVEHLEINTIAKKIIGIYNRVLQPTPVYQ